VLHQDRDLLVIEKPAGLASVPSKGSQGKTVLSKLRLQHPEAIAVHRLDQETSGVMVFARTEAMLRELTELFRTRAVEKVYWALVRGTPRPPQGTIRRPIKDLGPRAAVRADGKPAITHYRVTKRYHQVSLVEAQPETGRYNQIRLHFAAIGHPLVGERKYARGKDSPVKFRRVALHARSIRFDHPRTGKALKVRSRMPADLEALLQDLTEV
jgi:RluA family pseudouridine synthase